MDNIKRIYRKTRIKVKQLLGKELTIKKQVNYITEYHGNEYGGWSIFPKNINSDSIIYSFGVGEDVSFDLSLIQKYNVTVHAFDPTPKSIKWVKDHVLSNNFIMHEYGIAANDGYNEFFAPENPKYVSHSMIRKSCDKSEKFSVHKLATIMNDLGHSKIDILKMDIEGTEYEVIEDLLRSNIEVEQLLVEFHHRFDGVGISKTKEAIKMLNDNGYKIFDIALSREEYSFIKVTR